MACSGQVLSNIFLYCIKEVKYPYQYSDYLDIIDISILCDF
jgi:hypothetical protein